MVRLLLQEHLDARGMTQVELARRLGLTAVTVNAWVRGRYLPSLDMLDRIAVELGTTARELIAPGAPAAPTYFTTTTNLTNQ